MNTANKKHFMLYGGPNDGSRIPYEGEAPEFFDAPFPVAGNLPTLYQLNAAWSEHFKRPVMVPLDFPGTPPRQHAIA